jgi:hypothetical protein
MATIGLLHSDITEPILGAFYHVFNQLGSGFLESVYEASLEIDLVAAGLRVKRQAEVAVFFRRYCVGKFIADMVVNDRGAANQRPQGNVSGSGPDPQLWIQA